MMPFRTKAAASLRVASASLRLGQTGSMVFTAGAAVRREPKHNGVESVPPMRRRSPFKHRPARPDYGQLRDCRERHVTLDVGDVEGRVRAQGRRGRSARTYRLLAVPRATPTRVS